MRNAWLLAHKDMKEAAGRRMFFVRLLIPAVLLPMFYGALTGSALRDAARYPTHTDTLLEQVPMLAAIVVLLGSLVAVMVTADAIAGEKERRTLETLFATPIADHELFLGKLLAGLLPAIFIGYSGGAIYFLTARLWGGPLPLTLGPLLATARLILVGVPIVAAILAAAGVIISARAGTVTVASQLSSFASLPLFALVIYLSYHLVGWSVGEVLQVLAALLIVLLALLYFGARALSREEIVARLD